jgi:formylglycine-generating enzyme required for sulfatase activity
VLDMSGNVWEWTRSEFRRYPYDVDDGRENISGRRSIRVLRGGYFSNTSRAVRCAFRIGEDTSTEFKGFGFRVVVSPMAF